MTSLSGTDNPHKRGKNNQVRLNHKTSRQFFYPESRKSVSGPRNLSFRDTVSATNRHTSGKYPRCRKRKTERQHSDAHSRNQTYKQLSGNWDDNESQRAARNTRAGIRRNASRKEVLRAAVFHGKQAVQGCRPPPRKPAFSIFEGKSFSSIS